MADDTKKQIQIKPVMTPDALKGAYSNDVKISLMKEEVILDFFGVNPATQTAVLNSRIYLHPDHAKRFAELLQKVLSGKAVTSPGEQKSEKTGEIGFKTE